jgi:hypothetical protein
LIQSLRHSRQRELGFLGLVALTGLLIVLHLGGSGLVGRVEVPGGGWRAIDRGALERLIERGELRDREAEWFRPATSGDAAAGGPANGARP